MTARSPTGWNTSATNNTTPDRGPKRKMTGAQVLYNSKAYSAAGATSPLASTTIPRRHPTEHDVQIEILHCSKGATVILDQQCSCSQSMFRSSQPDGRFIPANVVSEGLAVVTGLFEILRQSPWLDAHLGERRIWQACGWQVRSTSRRQYVQVTGQSTIMPFFVHKRLVNFGLRPAMQPFSRNASAGGRCLPEQQ